MAIHKGLCTDCSAIEQTPGWGGSRKKNRTVVAVRGCLGSLPGFETGLYECPILAFADYTKDVLLKTDASKEGLGVVLSQKQSDG